MNELVIKLVGEFCWLVQ